MEEIILGREAVLARPREPMRRASGVSHAVLWQRAGSYAGVMWLELGGQVPSHEHAGAAHHVWVVEGLARVDSRVLEPGSYWYIPPGQPHAVAAAGDTACELFYLYLVESPAGRRTRVGLPTEHPAEPPRW
jgi:mannose-6-phosphate isomerase-like protein (cupin superfamily)